MLFMYSYHYYICAIYMHGKIVNCPDSRFHTTASPRRELLLISFFKKVNCSVMVRTNMFDDHVTVSESLGLILWIG